MTQTSSKQAPTLHFVGAAVRGQGHLKTNQPCQDAWQVASEAGATVACVCDGAGSAKHSDQGAKKLSQMVCDNLLNYVLAQPSAAIAEPELVNQLCDSLANCRQELANQGPLNDYHATLCGLVQHQQQNLVFHLGDGLIIGINPDDWQDYIVSEPENGDFAETTYFFTLDDWQSHLRVMCAPARYKIWFLMSDGCASFAAKTHPYAPDLKFLKPVHDYLASVESKLGSQALMATLDDPRTHSITQDDKTLVWLYNSSLAV
ncbi:PP2C family serine/threonine-protein phosphatase [Motilimonas sp. KMU-193]|uniref:PP2C family serine/threonine-protein phosphatase n=1 Tax=Motilimonas sp. KMU-193 TaxID=3388668 RepID=UPI00396B04B9